VGGGRTTTVGGGRTTTTGRTAGLTIGLTGNGLATGNEAGRKKAA